MLKKSSLVLAATLVATLSAQSAASANDTTRKIRDHRTPVVSVTVRDHRTTKEMRVRDHRTAKNNKARDHRTIRKNEVVIVDRKDCRLGYRKLQSRGFQNIVIQNCSGMKYKYFAKRNGDYYNAKMHAYSGSMELHRLGIIFNPNS